MRIEKIEHLQITIPFEAPIRWSQGWRSGTTRTLVRVFTDEGVTGLGETRGDDGIGSMIDTIAGKLAGEDPFQIELMLEKFHMLGYFNGYFGLSAIAGVEMALWDIMAKKAGRPLCHLLGGEYNSEVPFSGYIFYRQRTPDGKGGEDTPDKIVAFCQQAVDEYGFDCLKLKGGVFDPRQEIAAMQAIRDHFGPGFKLRIDPNGCWSPQTALWVCKELDKIGMEYIEDPTWGIEGMARLRRDIHTPIATNMCVVNFDTLPTGIREGAVDIILADPHKWGGVWTTKKLAAVCNAFRIGMSMHSGAELGGSMAANIQIAASTPEIGYSIDGHYHHIVDDYIMGGKHPYRKGKMRVPDAPGLGIEWDMEKVEHYHQRFLHGPQIYGLGENGEGGGKHLSRSQY